MTGQGYASIPLTVLFDEALSHEAKMVLLVLSAHVGAAVPPSQARIGEVAGLSRSTVKRRLAELVEAGHLEVERHRTDDGATAPNTYRLTGSVAPKPAKQGGSHRPPPLVHADPLPGSEGTTRKSGRGTRLPDGWQPSAELVAWAVSELGVTAEFGRAETAKFCDYWRGRAGAGGVKLDWPATWRNWIRRAHDDVKDREARRRGGKGPAAPRVVGQRTGTDW